MRTMKCLRTFRKELGGLMAVSVIPTLDMERAIAASGYDVIVGFDEVGRGSLAGPVMVGAAAISARD